MALKLLETPPDVVGDIIECGTFKGGSAANLSLVCRIVGRKLLVYDSFEGLPKSEESDRTAGGYHEGDFRGTLDEVTTNIKRYGALECCRFEKGWFRDTLPRLDNP
ncbi:TylF/MycF/NovP-related O-methyltransferase, partial [Chloroflexota bacterium]